MSAIDNAPALLTTALQDLYAGERAAAERLAVLIAHASDPALAEALTRQRSRFAQQAELLAASGRAIDGPDNLWMQGMLDDADRDTQSVTPGPLLDAALIGAVRKMLAAKLVSYETAVGLAERLGEVDLAAMLVRCRNEESASDDRLAVLLDERTAQTVI